MSQKTGDDLDDLPEDFYEYGEEEGGFEEEEAPTVLYSEDFISRPILSENSELPEDILEFDFSYSYDCKRYFNLCCMEEDIVVFASGNLINFYNVVTKDLWFRRSFLGGGIGHIARNPNKDYYHMAVAENGENPPIIIYEWPTLEIVSVLKEGAAKRYAHINYSPNGELLASQSYGPDFLITIWNWKRSRIILRVKSHVIDVDRVKFSPYVPGHITTGGSGHIKFWKMAQTFTGLKLQGELGRFGKTEISDILGIFPMPDEKVLSGSEWGNILVWEAGLIKVEVFRTKRRKCHEKPIVHFEYIHGELWTISMDGWCRAWNYKFIDDADPPDTDRVVQVVVSFERESPGVQFLSISKQNPYDPEHSMYYAQDGNGGIWLIDLALHTTYQPSVKLYQSHAGAVVDIASCPWGRYLISLGIDGKLIFYNYLDRKLLHIHQFPAKGRRILWLPLHLDPSGSTLVLAFDDGVMRVVQVDIKSDEDISVKVIQILKPHTKPITCFELNKAGNLLVTGSEDKTIFMFCIDYINKIFTLVPIGYVGVPSQVICLTWHPEQLDLIYVGCLYGELLEFTVPLEPQDYTEITFILHIEPRRQRFTTVKAQIRRDIKIREIEARKLKKLQKKKDELATIKANNPGLEIDEDQFLQDSESEEELEPLYFPEIPNRICFIMYTPDDNLWLSMSGYDAGYIYEYTMDQKEEIPTKSTIVCEADDLELHNFLYSHNKKYIIFTMHTGIIRLCRVDEEDFRNLSDYWQLSMHDNYNGTVNRICFSYDSRFFFSCGNDGNIFSYKFNPEDEEYLDQDISLEPIPEAIEIKDEDNYETLSLEQAKVKADYDKQMKLANDHKTLLKNRLKELETELEGILLSNCDLPRSQRIPLDHFILDQRIMDAFEESLRAKVELQKRKVAHQLEKSTIGLQKLMDFFITPLDFYPFVVHGFENDKTIKTIHHRNLGFSFLEMEEIVQRKLIEEELKYRVPERRKIATEMRTKMRKRVGELEPFLVGLSPSTIAFKLGSRLSRMLNKYRERKAAEERRADEWQLMNSIKPVDGVNHPDDETALNIAKETIGDFKLKSAADYKVPKALKTSTVRKYDELLRCRKECYSIRHDFNKKVYNLRQKKVEIIKYLEKKVAELVEIQSELPFQNIKPIPSVPEISSDDFPEKKYEVVIKLHIPEKKPKEKMVPLEYVINDLDLIGDIPRLPNIPGDIPEICEKEAVKFKRLERDINIDEFEGLKYDESDRTPWEYEFLVRRLINKIIDQDNIIADMKKCKKDFDDELDRLRDEKIDVLPKGTLSELHLLVLHQQVLIVKEFENAEDNLLAIVEERTNDMMDMKDNMKKIQNTIEQHHSDINHNNDKIKDVQQLFINTAKDNKFWDFLRRIFRKKYKPPKIRDPDDTESSSSSDDDSDEDTDEDDAGSLDSREIGPIRLDESVCPKGCDKELYDYTFTLRNERHGYDRDIKEHLKSIDTLKKELENCNKKLKKFELNLKQSLDNLEEFQRERQKRLNEILSISIMKLHQIKHLDLDSVPKKVLSNVLVFSEPVYKKLFERVNELKIETLHQIASHRKNKMHLHRMTIDCKSMEMKIKQLKKKILNEMILKFGSRVNLDELEEAILRRLVQELRVAMLNIRGEFEKELSSWTDTFGDKQIELKNTIRDNTARLQVFAIMSQERSSMGHFLKLQSKKIEMLDKGDMKPDEYFTGDLSKLKKVVDMQSEQINELKKAIKSLTIKELPPLPIVYTPLPEKKKEVSEFEEYDPSLEDIYVPPPHVQQQVDILQRALKKETEDELQATVEDLIVEIIDTQMRKAKSFEEGVGNIISDLVEQIPDEYLEDAGSKTMITTKLKEIHDGKSMINVASVMAQLDNQYPDHPHATRMKSLILDILKRSFDLYIYHPNQSIESTESMNLGNKSTE